MNIRDERPDDVAAIFALTQAAFADRPYSSGTEGPIINALRRDGDLSLSLVAEREDELIGHIAFSPVTLSGERDGLFALGPVSVLPALQKRGIGSALIRQGLSELEAKAVVLIGDPNYYHRFGFVGDCGLSYGQVPADYVQILSLDGQNRTGEIIYSPAFETI